MMSNHEGGLHQARYNTRCYYSQQPNGPHVYRFYKVDPSKDSKENILVLTDAFTNFSQAFVTPNQKSITITKILVDKWFYVYGIPARIHSDKGCSFDNEILSHCMLCMGLSNLPPCLTICMEMLPLKD